MPRIPRPPLLALLLIMALAHAGAQAGEPVTLITGEAGGGAHLAGGALCQALLERAGETGIHCRVSRSEGPVANLQALRAGEHTLAVVRSDLAVHALRGTGPFAGTPAHAELRALLALNREALVIVVRGDSDIRHPRDLPGHHLAHGPDASGHRAGIDPLMDAQGWIDQDFARISRLGTAARVDALCSGAIDAAVFIAAQPDPVIRRALDCGGRAIPLAGAAIDRMVRGYPHYTRTWIRAGTYPDIREDLPVYAMTAMLVTTTALRGDTARLVTDVLLAQSERLGDWHPSLAEFDMAERIRATHAGRLPLHQAAETRLQATQAE